VTENLQEIVILHGTKAKIMESRYVNPFTDFGFKKLFGADASKPALIDFLNSLLPIQSQIKDLSFKNPEQLGSNINDRKAVYDIYCEGVDGEKFIVELQKAKQNFFKERTIFYSTFPITEQAKQGVEWNFNLTSVFCIGVLDFKFSDYGDEADKNLVKHEIKLKNQNGQTFYDKLTYIYLEMPNFNKTENELETRLDKWLYFIKYLKNFQSIPQIFKNEVVFTSAFEKAEVAKYSREELASYNSSLKVYWDINNVIDTAKMDGIAIGKAEGKAETAKILKGKGIAIDVIMDATGLSKEEIERL
jgi:predicted transposase/invertase (TIGR01784 family)